MKGCHMTFEERLEIESGLKLKKSLTEIATTIDKDLGTVRKEIINHRTKKYPSSFNGKRNICKSYVLNDCKIQNLCNIDSCNKFCKSCSRHMCNELCPYFEEYLCEHLLHKPYSCNGCEKKGQCHNIKMYYYAKDADLSYHERLSTTRLGPNITEKEINYINNNVVPLVKAGQSFDNIIMADNGLTVPVSKQTLYNYTEKGYINLKNIDLPKKVCYKKREKKEDTNNTKKKETVIDKLKESRNYDKFKLFIQQHPNYNIVEMDTVEGVKGGKLLLTLLFRKSNFMIAFLIDDKKAETINKQLDYLKKLLTPTTFRFLFRVILTDNGVEFTMIEEIEKLENNQKINLFFCDPGKSGQKGKIEKNHVELRKILIKGSSFDHLTQKDIDLIMSHVNSYKRKKLNWKSPIELVEEEYGEDIINKLNYKKIADKDIVLKPSLLTKKDKDK